MYKGLQEKVTPSEESLATINPCHSVEEQESCNFYDFVI